MNTNFMPIYIRILQTKSKTILGKSGVWANIILA